MSDTSPTVTPPAPADSEEAEQDQELAGAHLDEVKPELGPFSHQGEIKSEPTVEKGSDPANINREEDSRNRAEVEGVLEAESRIRLAQKHPAEQTGQGTPLPVSEPVPALTPSSPVTRDQLTTETQRQGTELQEQAGEEGQEPSENDEEEEEYPSTVEPSP